MMPAASSSFDPDFASPGEWAAMYREHGMQVVPGCYPMRGKGDKRPALSEWKEFQTKPIPFDLFYGPGGRFASVPNMGLIAGAISGNAFVIDLDDHVKPSAADWWTALLALNNYGEPLWTWEQRTGGGGRQLFFIAPAHWRPPTNKTSIGVDIRGEGGFALIPPTRHFSGREYEWLPGRGPWECDCLPAPQWLLDAIDLLVEEHGGHQGPERTADPATQFDGFGNLIDGRETYMTRLVWGAVVDLYRDAPIKPPPTQSQEEMLKAYAIYERKVGSRLSGADKAQLLEREGRGITAFALKWRRAMAQWDGKIRDAANERPKEAPRPENPVADETDQPIFVGDLTGEPKPREWLVDQWIPKGVVSALYGDGGVGKTLLAQQLLYAAGVGGKWLGLPVEPTRGLGVFCEDDADELHRRHNDIKASLGYPIENPFTDTWIWPRVGFDNLLVTFDRDNRPTMSVFFQAVLKQVLENKIGLLISTCGAFIKQTKEAGFPLTVLLLAHPSQAGRNSGTGESGSTGWNNAVRSRLYLTRPEEGTNDSRVLTRMKSNYAASGSDTALELIWVNGVLIPPTLAVSDPDARGAVEEAVSAKIVSLIRGAWSHGRPYKGRKDSDYFLEKKMPADLSDEYPRPVVLAAIRNLQRNEIIAVDRSGDRRGYRVLGDPK
jgi:hypothetical protein